MSAARPSRVPELLAPAGGPAAFWAALAAGADAIYCGLGSDLNARRGADNFSDEDFRAACRAAHLAGARVYVTVNVVVKQREMAFALALVRRAWLLGADAFIIQDWGLLGEVRALWPEVEVHVSTQANVHDPRGVAFCRALGASRVTLSRELSLPEIAAISRQERVVDGGCELEVFGHGALCFCYSGICLLSSMRGLTEHVRSANRGLCAQPCRLPYELVDVDGRTLSAPGRTRPLCPKDSCSAELLYELADAGADALKIEGRMKAPDYVWSVTSAYREALDELAAGRGIDASIASERLKRTFNRNLTDAYLLGTSGDEMMSYERSNNRGLVVGSVTASRLLHPERRPRGGSAGGRQRGKVLTPAETSVALTDDVSEGDLLEIRPASDPDQFLTAPVRADARAGETIEVRTARPMEEGSCVRVIRTQAALDSVAAIEGKAAAGAPVRRRPCDVRVVCRLGEPFRVELTCGGALGVAEGPVVEAARTRELTEADLIEHVGRMGGTPFEPRSFAVELDAGCGMGFSGVHAVRADACAALERSLLAPWEGRELAEPPREAGPTGTFAVLPPAPSGKSDSSASVEVCAEVTSPEAARATLAAGATRLYASADDLDAADGWPEGVVPVLPEVCRASDQAQADAFVREGSPVAVGCVSELALASERGAVPEVRGMIPVHNASTASVLASAGARFAWLSCELTLEEVGRLARLSPMPVGLVVSGRQRVMTSEHCVLQVADRCIHDCPRCALRLSEAFLRDEWGNLMPVRTDVHGRSRIWLADALDAVPEVPALVAAGVTRLLVDGTLLAPDEVSREVGRLVEALDAARQGRPAPKREPGANPGHLYRELD